MHWVPGSQSGVHFNRAVPTESWGPSFAWYQHQELCLRATNLVTPCPRSFTQTHSWFLSVPSCLNSWDVFWEGDGWGGRRLAHTGEEVLCHPVKLACGRSKTRVLWPKHFVFLCRSLRVLGFGLSEASSMAGSWLGAVLCQGVSGWGGGRV